MKIKILLIFVLFLYFSCKEKQVEISTSIESKIVLQDSLILESISIKDLEYNLHPYSGYPVFTFNKNSNFYYNIIPISIDSKYKDIWNYDELSFNESLVNKSKKYIFDNFDKYKLVLFLVDNNLQKQGDTYEPTENFKYKLFVFEKDKWVQKKQNIFKDDIFIYLDSEFQNEAKVLISE